MINKWRAIFETEKKNDDGSYKMKDVGSGYGKWAGATLAGFPGMVAGHYIGKNTPENPKATADLKKKSHRAGIIASEQMNAKRILKGAGIGLGTGAALGAGASLLDLDIGKILSDYPVKAAVMSGLLGASGGMMVGGYKGAKKLGYGKVGKTIATLTPLAGLGKPKVQQDESRK